MPCIVGERYERNVNKEFLSGRSISARMMITGLKAYKPIISAGIGV
jgi:hypothetical protein